MIPAEKQVVEWAQRLRAFNPDSWAELVMAAELLRHHYRDRAIDGPSDNGLTIGFARGISRFHELLTYERTP